MEGAPGWLAVWLAAPNCGGAAHAVQEEEQALHSHSIPTGCDHLAGRLV
jgi:hypothetical protein